jgi:hypothetical protein
MRCLIEVVRKWRKLAREGRERSWLEDLIRATVDKRARAEPWKRNVQNWCARKVLGETKKKQREHEIAWCGRRETLGD